MSIGLHSHREHTSEGKLAGVGAEPSRNISEHLPGSERLSVPLAHLQMWAHLLSHQAGPRDADWTSCQRPQDCWVTSDPPWAVLQASGGPEILPAVRVHPSPAAAAAVSSFLAHEELVLEGGRGTAGVSRLHWPKIIPLLHPFPSSLILLKCAEARPMQNLPWRHFERTDDKQEEGRMFYGLSSLPSSGFWQKWLDFLLSISLAEGM